MQSTDPLWSQVGDALKPVSEVGTTVLTGLSFIPKGANALSSLEWQGMSGAWQGINGAWKAVNFGQQ